MIFKIFEIHRSLLDNVDEVDKDKDKWTQFVGKKSGFIAYKPTFFGEEIEKYH